MPDLPELVNTNSDCISTLYNKYGHLNRAFGASLLDVSARYRQWSNSIGAAQPVSLPTSLAYRLRAALKLHDLFKSRLSDLREDLNDLILALDELPHERLGEIGHLTALSTTEPVHSTESDPVVDIEELLKASSEDVSALFKLSIAARRSTTRDRYARALARVSPTEVLGEGAELDAVGDQFPTLRFAELQWLRHRLAKANTCRRQYLEYCRRHADAIEGRNQPAESPHLQQHVPPRSETFGRLALEQTIDAESADQVTIGYQTTASTARGTLFERDEQTLEQPTYEDAESTYSYATQSRSEATLQVPALETVNDGSYTIICPYCRTEQAIPSETAWRTHVFADLKAYCCTHKSCELRMFESSHAWLAHELSEHFAIPHCPYCNDFDAIKSTQTLRDHLMATHGDRFDIEQLPRLLQTSSVIPDQMPASVCPMCDWTTKLRYGNSSTSPESGDILVSVQRYRRHMAAHLEQIALATIVSCPDDSAEESYRSDDDSPDESAADEGAAINWINAYTFIAHTDRINSIAFSPSGSLLASASTDGTIRMWSTSTGKWSPPLLDNVRPVRTIVFSPDGTLLASVAASGGVRLWDVATATEQWRSSDAAAEDIAFTPDGRTLVWPYLTGGVAFRDIADGTYVESWIDRNIARDSVAFSPDGVQMVSVGLDKPISLFRVTRGPLGGIDFVRIEFEQHLEGVRNPNSSYNFPLAFSPDGKQLASALSAPFAILLYDTRSWRVQRVMRHDDAISAFAFSPDSKFIASGSLDRVLRIWDCATGVELQRLEGHHQRINAVAWSPDGRHVASASDDNVVSLWKAQ